jgi:hypothetical protein
MGGFSKGQAGIVLSLAIPVLVGIVCLTADTAAVYRERAKLQTIADSAVLLGAAYLPANPADARIVALRYVEQKGASARIEIIYDQVSADRRSLRMMVRHEVDCSLGRLLGLEHDVVVAKAVAEIKPLGRAVSPIKARPGIGNQRASARMLTLTRDGPPTESFSARPSEG